MNGVYSEFAEEGLNSKKYIVYEKLNKIGGGKTFNNAKDACKYAKETLADYGFTIFMYHSKSVIDLDEESWDKLTDVNLKGYWLMIQEVSPIMMRIQKSLQIEMVLMHQLPM